jgi:hypothetical protein
VFTLRDVFTVREMCLRLGRCVYGGGDVFTVGKMCLRRGKWFTVGEMVYLEGDGLR